VKKPKALAVSAVTNASTRSSKTRGEKKMHHFFSYLLSSFDNEVATRIKRALT
jgi:hypothetical protein